jgi:hypothetical protein
MMTEYQKEQQVKNGALSALTAEIAKELGAPWKVRPLRPDRDEENYPTRWIVNGEGAELWVRIEEYGAQKGRVKVSGSLHINGQFQTVYENGNRASVPDISVNPERGVAVIAKEIKRRLLPDYLRVLAFALAQADRHNQQTKARQQAIRELLALTGGEAPDFSRDADRDRFHLPGHRSGTVTVHYDGSVNLERLSVSREEAEYILRHLYRPQNGKE